MDLKKVKPSKNFQDKTGQSERGKMVDYLLGLVNPKTAYHNVRDAMLRNGYIDAPERTIKYQMKFDPSIKPSLGAFVDRTGGHQDFITGNPPRIDDKTRDFMRAMVIDQIRRKLAMKPEPSIKKKTKVTPYNDPLLGDAYRNEDYEDWHP